MQSKAPSPSGATPAGPDVIPVRPPAPDLDGEERSRLERGEIVYKAVEQDPHRTTGISCGFVRAPRERIWNEILSFDSYRSFLPYVTSCRSLDREPIPGGERIRVELELTTMGMVTRYRLDNRCYPEICLVAWSLEPGALNPLHRVKGTWTVYPGPDPEQWLVVYRAEVDVRWWLPEFLKVRAADRGLPVLLTCIRKRAEGHGG